ncbi:RNA polymerase subunit sigma-24 [Paenibacillus tianmuensis]|nr:RNA polymerase subunit sigma-24 [Paenibacillus tianmuensis]
MAKDYEQAVIKQLQEYRRIVARMKVLEKYPIGAGMSLNVVNEDDKLQELHRQLRGLPSYMYLTKREQQLESVAHTYLARYPAGTRAQLAAVPPSGADAEDEKLLRELRGKIEKVIEARGGRLDDFEAAVERISELQDLEQQKQYIEHTLKVFEEYKPQYAKLLWLQYIEDKPIEDVVTELRIVRRTYGRWRSKALEEYGKLIGMS